jgi:hypothetical protein
VIASVTTSLSRSWRLVGYLLSRLGTTLPYYARRLDWSSVSSDIACENDLSLHPLFGPPDCVKSAGGDSSRYHCGWMGLFYVGCRVLNPVLPSQRPSGV